VFHWGICAIVFVTIYLLIRALLSLLFGLVFGFSTLGVRVFGMTLSILTLCLGSGCVHSIGSVTLGCGSVVGSSFCGGLIVSSKVICHGSVGMARNSGIWSGSGVLLRMLSSSVNASICCNPLWFLFPFNACVSLLSALVIMSAGVMVGCVMNFVLKNTVSDTISFFCLFYIDDVASVVLWQCL
jgi:hypothetical protein